MSMGLSATRTHTRVISKFFYDARSNAKIEIFEMEAGSDFVYVKGIGRAILAAKVKLQVLLLTSEVEYRRP